MSGNNQKQQNQDLFAEVPLDLLHLISGFLGRREKEIGELLGFVSAGDFQSIKVISHKLKGTGAGYGLQIFSDLGKEMEIGAFSSNPEIVRKTIERFSTVTKTHIAQWHSRSKLSRGEV